MNHAHKIVVRLIIVLFILTLSSMTAFAATTTTINLPVFLKANQYFVLYTYPKAPYIDSKNRIMVPLRMFCGRLFGADVGFDHKTKIATVKFSGKTLKLTIGSKIIEVDGQPAELDTIPVLYEGNVFIPLRALTNAFGIKTEWNSQYGYVHLQDERIMKTQTILYMEDSTRAEIADKDAFIPVSSYLTLMKNKAGDNTHIKLVTKSRNVTGQDIPEGKEDIQVYIAFDTGYSYETPYSWQGRVRPLVEANGTLEKQIDTQYMPSDKINYILYWGRVIN